MRFVLGLFVVLIFSAGVVQADRERRFFTTLPDVPLVNGVFELSEQSISFDKPEGRIVESYAVLKHMSPKDVSALYNGVLPRFGWQKVDSDTFVRENESLTLTFEQEQDRHYLRVLVTPR